MSIKKSNLPLTSMLANSSYDYVDSFEGSFIDKNENIDAAKVGKAFFSSGPKWIEKLFSFRNAIVKRLGLKTPENILDRQKQLVAFKCEVGERLGLFQVYHRDENEVIIGEDDKHLDFRVSLYLQPNGNNGHEKTLTLSTVVKFHSWLGRLYFFPVKPFHKLIVPTMLKSIINNLKATPNHQ
ncbi:MAG: DUF2867 domain-containing protein [Pedobacter sp.]|uniref:DUF2867 domain-containing protein n=1 Tax=Pedobacter sp. TaxID=1411316 RepID=UPI0028076A82|nr:DUF2867 domain-containing protein [Pedobacter sp.]MDQ8003232.1 DUF2867 domain-containing protein [Pedobacter sp.]